MVVKRRLKLIKKYKIDEEVGKVYNKLKNKFNCIDTEVKESIIEETAGGLTSSLFVGVFAVAGTTMALFSHPVAGCVILVFSIVIGSISKVFAGRAYRKRQNKDFNEKLEELFKENNVVECKLKKSETSRYAFLRMVSFPSKNNKVKPIREKE